MPTVKEGEPITKKLFNGFIRLFGKVYGESLLKGVRKKSKLLPETSSEQIGSEPPEG